MPPNPLAGPLGPETRRDAARHCLAALFRESGIESADLDARLLVCAACDIDHAGLVRDPDRPLGPAAERLAGWAERRRAREPVSRILGRREFWGLPFTIAPAVLDPRPETEGLVGSVLDAIGGRRDAPLRVLDLGTGSSAILAALLSELPNASGLGIDRSLAACRIARENLESLGLAGRALIVCGSWADAVGALFDIVVANPPYIPRGDLAHLDPDVRDHDPLAALDGGLDGLDPYRAIVPRLDSLLSPGGLAAFECGLNQGEPLAALTRATLAGVMVYKDLAGHDRVVLGLKQSKEEPILMKSLGVRRESA